MFSSSAHKSSLPTLSNFPTSPSKGASSDNLELRSKKGELYIHSGKPAFMTNADGRRKEQVAGMVALLRGFEESLRATVGTLDQNDATIKLLRQRTVTPLRLETLAADQIDSKAIQARMTDSKGMATAGHVKELRHYCLHLGNVLKNMRSPDALRAQAVVNFAYSHHGGAARHDASFLAAVAGRLDATRTKFQEASAEDVRAAWSAASAHLLVTDRPPTSATRPAATAAAATVPAAQSDGTRGQWRVIELPPLQRPAAAQSDTAQTPTEAAQRQASVLAILSGRKVPPGKLDAVASALCKLTPDRMDKLLGAIDEGIPKVFRTENGADVVVRIANSLHLGVPGTPAEVIDRQTTAAERERYK